jgi:hypothetical protein
MKDRLLQEQSRDVGGEGGFPFLQVSLRKQVFENAEEIEALGDCMVAEVRRAEKDDAVSARLELLGDLEEGIEMPSLRHWIAEDHSRLILSVNRSAATRLRLRATW